MIRLFVFMILFSTSLLTQPSRSQDIFSEVRGYIALQQFVLSKERQDELDVSPDQLVRLSEVLKSDKIRSAALQKARDGHGIVKDSPITDEILAALGETRRRISIDNVDDLVAIEFARILVPDQIEAMRITRLRKIKFPLATLGRNALSQVRIPKNEIQQLHAVDSQFTLRSAAVAKEIRDLRMRAVAGLLVNFPDASKQRFVGCFGRDYAPEASRLFSFDEKSVGIFREDHGYVLLDTMYSIDRRKDVAATPPQREEISRIVALLRVKQSTDPTFDVQKAGKEAAEALLTLDQRKAAGLIIHQRLLEDDLKNVVRPEVTQYLQLPPDVIPTLKDACAERQRDIDQRRLELELQLFKQTIATMSQDSRAAMRLLYDKVWCDLN